MDTTANSAIAGSTQRPSTAARAHSTDAGTAKLATIRLVLRLTFTVVPIVAGLDKFTNLLTNWEAYLNPMLVHVLPVGPAVFMKVSGVIEILAGIIVFYRPRIGALIVSAWLVAIALSLLASGHYLDVAVRDLVMAVSAFTLASLTQAVELQRQRE
ncbi:MAG TPA: tRNA (5-methylaminomethyl-2-thiouridylate)-methyltransferase [Bacteroidota bacterium]